MLQNLAIRGTRGREVSEEGLEKTKCHGEGMSDPMRMRGLPRPGRAENLADQFRLMRRGTVQEGGAAANAAPGSCFLVT